VRQNCRFSVSQRVDIFVVGHNWRRLTGATVSASQINACCGADGNIAGPEPRTCERVSRRGPLMSVGSAFLRLPVCLYAAAGGGGAAWQCASLIAGVEEVVKSSRS